MIINKQRKVIVYNVPRTGTFSLRTAARQARQRANVRFDYLTEGHSNYLDIRQSIDLGEYVYGGINDKNDLDTYEQYVFVRDPFDRAISGLNLLRRGRLHHNLLYAFYGHKYRHEGVRCFQRDGDYDNFPQWKKDAIEAIPMIQVFRRMKWWFKRGPYTMGHMGFIEGPVQPLMFSDYPREARRVMGRLGIPANIDLPSENSAKRIPENDYLSPRQEQEIKDYFHEDYEYLDSKGIHFNK